MLAVYFALADNLLEIKKAASPGKNRHVAIAIRSDSKSTVDQLLGVSAIRDSVMRRIFHAIGKLLTKIRCTITFDHLERSHNIAGLLIEQKRRKEREEEELLLTIRTRRRIEPAIATGVISIRSMETIAPLAAMLCS